MFVHIVTWKVKESAEGLDKKEITAKMKSMLDALPDQIDVIKEFEVGLDVIHSDRSFDVSLYSVFANEADFKAYAKHPKHMIVVEFFKKVVDKAVAVDYVK